MRKGINFKSRVYKGFSLIELLIVVAILALIIVIAVWIYRLQMLKAWDARRKADLDKIKIAVEEYEKDHDCYPPESLLSCNPGTGLKPYINLVPCDPRTKISYTYEISADNCPRWFRLYSILDIRQDPIKDKINCTNNCGPNCAYQYYVASSNTFDTTTCGPVGGGPSGSGGTLPSPTTSPDCNFWGCISGVCVPLDCYPETSDPVCSPNYSNKNLCDSQCAGNPGQFACKSNE